MARPLTVVFLAAGLGRRFGGAKQITGFGPHGELLLEYSAFDALRGGFARAIVVTRPELEDALDRRLRPAFGRDLVFAHQRADDLPPGVVADSRRDPARALGTAHAVWCARAVADGPFAVANADDLYGQDSWELLAAALGASTETPEAAASHCLIGFQLDRTLSAHGGVSRAVCRIDPSGVLTGIDEIRDVREEGGAIAGTFGSERRALASRATVSLNLWGFQRSIMGVLEAALATFLSEEPPNGECHLPSVVHDAIRRGLRVTVLRSAAPWMGVTHAADAPRVRAELAAAVRSGVYPSPLFGRRGPPWSGSV